MISHVSEPSLASDLMAYISKATRNWHVHQQQQRQNIAKQHMRTQAGISCKDQRKEGATDLQKKYLAPGLISAQNLSESYLFFSSLVFHIHS